MTIASNHEPRASFAFAHDRRLILREEWPFPRVVDRVVSRPTPEAK